MDSDSIKGQFFNGKCKIAFLFKTNYSEKSAYSSLQDLPIAHFNNAVGAVSKFIIVGDDQ
jgi:hypothetical protein